MPDTNPSSAPVKRAAPPNGAWNPAAASQPHLTEGQFKDELVRTRVGALMSPEQLERILGERKAQSEQGPAEFPLVGRNMVILDGKSIQDELVAASRSGQRHFFMTASQSNGTETIEPQRYDNAAYHLSLRTDITAGPPAQMSYSDLLVEALRARAHDGPEPFNGLEGVWQFARDMEAYGHIHPRNEAEAWALASIMAEHGHEIAQVMFSAHIENQVSLVSTRTPEGTKRSWKVEPIAQPIDNKVSTLLVFGLDGSLREGVAPGLALSDAWKAACYETALAGYRGYFATVRKGAWEASQEGADPNSPVTGHIIPIGISAFKNDPKVVAAALRRAWYEHRKMVDDWGKAGTGTEHLGLLHPMTFSVDMLDNKGVNADFANALTEMPCHYIPTNRLETAQEAAAKARMPSRGLQPTGVPSLQGKVLESGAFELCSFTAAEAMPPGELFHSSLVRAGAGGPLVVEGSQCASSSALPASGLPSLDLYCAASQYDGSGVRAGAFDRYAAKDGIARTLADRAKDRQVPLHEDVWPFKSTVLPGKVNPAKDGMLVVANDAEATAVSAIFHQRGVHLKLLAVTGALANDRTREATTVLLPSVRPTADGDIRPDAWNDACYQTARAAYEGYFNYARRKAIESGRPVNVHVENIGRHPACNPAVFAMAARDACAAHRAAIESMPVQTRAQQQEKARCEGIRLSLAGEDRAFLEALQADAPNVEIKNPYQGSVVPLAEAAGFAAHRDFESYPQLGKTDAGRMQAWMLFDRVAGSQKAGGVTISPSRVSPATGRETVTLNLDGGLYLNHGRDNEKKVSSLEIVKDRTAHGGGSFRVAAAEQSGDETKHDPLPEAEAHAVLNFCAGGASLPPELRLGGVVAVREVNERIAKALQAHTGMHLGWGSSSSEPRDAGTPQDGAVRPLPKASPISPPHHTAILKSVENPASAISSPQQRPGASTAGQPPAHSNVPQLLAPVVLPRPGGTNPPHYTQMPVLAEQRPQQQQMQNQREYMSRTDRNTVQYSEALACLEPTSAPQAGQPHSQPQPQRQRQRQRQQKSCTLQ